MLHPILVLLVGFILVPGRECDAGYFMNPSTNTDTNPVWTLGDEQVISWRTSLDVFNISMWQESLVSVGAASTGNVYSKIHSYDQVTNFTWVVQLYGFNLDYSNVFFFWVNANKPDGFVSSYFNITKPTSTSTTTTTTDSAPAATSSSTSHDLPSAPVTTQSSSSGLKTTRKIALGVGIGVGVPVLCALVVLIWLLIRSSKRNHQVAAAVDPAPVYWPPMQHRHHYQHQQQDWHWPPGPPLQKAAREADATELPAQLQ